MGIQYRPEIDGLRAIAVLAVVLFHAGVGAAGFVGVDVFFVISGYLITSLLLAEHARTGSIDLLAFYARRVRRIFPAAAVVVLATLGASAFLLDVEEQSQTARSAGAALAFGANVFFQLTTGGYWDASSEEMPLLHLWSLSVEEQFYFVWPALLLFVRSRRAMLALAIASLALAEYWIDQKSDAAFFEMPARFWELAAGGLIAASPARALHRWVAPIGVVATLVACVVPPMHFPGVGALPAVLGACAVIAAVHGGARNRFLSSKPMVAVGLVSYSLYLWHWPLLAFYRANGGDSLAVRLALCAAALALAALSYRCVEQPFRRMRFRSGRTVAVGATLSAALALSACAIGMRVPAAPDTAIEQLAARIEHDKMPIDCEYEPGDSVPKCPDPVGAKVAIWGDSMALAWRAGLPTATLQYTTHGCAPALNYGEARCHEFGEAVVERLGRVDTLYIAARWPGYAHLDMAPTFERLRGVRHVILIGPSPQMRASVPRCLRKSMPCAISRAEFDAKAAPVLAMLRRQAQPFPNVEIVDVGDAFCTATECPPIRDGLGMYWDTHHVSKTQARIVLRDFDQRGVVKE